MKEKSKEFIYPIEGEPDLEKIDKSKEADDKEAEKVLKAAEKAVDEINTARVKLVKEKLILPEVDDSIINEGFDELDEAVPKDLIKPFTKANPTKRNVNQSRRYKYFGTNDNYEKFHQPVDFQNSEYTEITPEEAMDLKKTHPEQVMAIFDGQLVNFDTDGKQLYRAERTPNSPKGKYNRPNGESQEHTGKLTFNTIVNNAEKVYKINEVPKDPDLVAQRKANPESGRKYGRSMDYANIYAQMLSDKRRNYSPNSPEYNKLSDKLNNIDDIRGAYHHAADDWAMSSARYSKSQANWYKQKAQNTDDPDLKANYLASYDSYMSLYRDSMSRYKSSLSKNKDYNARLRYKSSEDNLQSELKQLASFKSNIYGLEKQVKDAEQNLEVTKASGSKETRHNLEQIANYKARLKDLQRIIDRYEMYLEDSREGDAEAIVKAQQALDELNAKYDEAKKGIYQLIGRQTESLDEDNSLTGGTPGFDDNGRPIWGDLDFEHIYKHLDELQAQKDAWDRAKLNKVKSPISEIDEDIEALNKVKEAGKMKALNGLIDELYPEGVTVDQVKDILKYEGDYVLDSLGINGEE